AAVVPEILRDVVDRVAATVLSVGAVDALVGDPVVDHPLPAGRLRRSRRSADQGGEHAEQGGDKDDGDGPGGTDHSAYLLGDGGIVISLSDGRDARISPLLSICKPGGGASFAPCGRERWPCSRRPACSSAPRFSSAAVRATGVSRFSAPAPRWRRPGLSSPRSGARCLCPRWAARAWRSR